MPTYALRCPKCDRPIEELQAPISERANLKCPGCDGPLETDYSRHRTSSFVLKGSDWPGKEIKIENQIMKDRS